MINDLLSLKAASIERCVSRAREEYASAPNAFAADQPVQAAAILKILRSCPAMQDMGQHLIHRECFGVPQSARDVLKIVPTLPRLDAKRPEFEPPRRSVGAIKASSP